MSIATAFLSHSSVDKPLVQNVADALCRRGVIPWLDKNDLPPGSDFMERLEKAIDRQVVIIPFLPENRRGAEGTQDEVREVLRLKDERQYHDWIFPVNVEESLEADSTADDISQHIYRLLNFKQTNDVNIVIDQRGRGSRKDPYEFSPTIDELVAHPTLVFRPDMKNRSVFETLVGEGWQEFRQIVDSSLSKALGKLKTGMKIRILGDAQLGIPFFLGQQFDRTSVVDLYCYNTRHKTAFTNTGQKRYRLLSDGNSHCETVRSQPLLSAPVNSDQKIQRLHQRHDELNQLLKLLGQKRFLLEKQKVTETRVEEKFRLEQSIADVNAEHLDIEKIIDDVEARLFPRNNYKDDPGQKEEQYNDLLPQKLNSDESYKTVALYIGKRNFLPAVCDHIQNLFPFVFVETKYFDTSDEVMEFVRDVVTLLQRLRAENHTTKIRLYCDLPFNVIPLLSANLTHAMNTIEFMEYRYDRKVQGCAPHELYTYLPMYFGDS